MRKIKPTPSPDPPTASIREAVRTPLFWLLHDNHARLVETWGSNRVRWATVCAWAAAHGVPDQPPNAVRMTWARVCAAKAQEKAEREAKQRPAHLRSPAINHAPVIAPPPQSRSQPPAPQETPQSDVERRMAEMKAMINRRSGRLA